MRELTAVGCYIFAGGFTLGVEQSFKVLAHLEGSDYGVKTFKMNRPNIPVHMNPRDWPIKDFEGVDFIYCNPPCAPFSVCGASLRNGGDNWKTDPRMSCHHNSFNLFEKVRPNALAIESVPMAYKRGKTLWDNLTVRALDMGYSVTHLFEDSRWLGVPQRRERYMFMCHRHELTMERLNWAPPPTIGEVLDSVAEPGWYPRQSNPSVQAAYEKTPPGVGIRTVWEQLNPPDTWEHGPNGVKGRPRFCEYRAQRDEQVGAFIGDFLLHPTKHRRLGLEEAKAICGFPQEFQFANPRYAFSELARGVLPCVGAFVARSVAASIQRGQVVTEPGVRIVDMRRPRETVDEMITPLYPVKVPLTTGAIATNNEERVNV